MMAFLLALVGCGKEVIVQTDDADCIVKPGDQVVFSAGMSMSPETKAFPAYTPVAGDALYEFNVEMYRDGVADAIGSSIYVPMPEPETGKEGTLILKQGVLPLYWEDNVNRYGFKATAGSGQLVVDATGLSDQSTPAKFILNDRLEGYAAAGTDDKTVLNHHVLKDWIAANRTAGIQTEEEYKKVPLYLSHKKSLVTVILKASEGVKREDLKFDTQAENIQVSIFSSKGDGTYNAVRPLAEQTTVDYEHADINGPAQNGVETTCYHAIIDPTDFLSVADTDPVCTINLSGQKFSFYASSDPEVNLYKTNPQDHQGVVAAYNLAAGKHLTITATLSRSSRKVLITAYVEDWKEVAMTTICDDYGKNGDPVVVSSADDLYDALTDQHVNATGNVVMLSSDIDLSTLTKASDWPEDITLRCLLNMSGRKISTSKRLFSSLEAAATLVNGSVEISGNMRSVVAETNYGIIERVAISVAEGQTAMASVAGFVATNYRTIFNCESDVPVKGSATDYIGGIAGQSLYSATGSTAPVIDGCTMNAKVDFEGHGVTVGGIVGKANGRVSGNRYEYGVTLSQVSRKESNDAISEIVAESAHTADTPLTDSGNTYPSEYDGIIDSREDLEIIFDTNSGLNAASKIFRISGDFTVTQGFGAKDADVTASVAGNILFTLDGNGKTITVEPSAPNFMLFRNIVGKVSDLTVRVAAPVESTYNLPDVATHPFDDFDAVAPFAYAVAGGTLENVRVYTTGDAYIKATNAAGIAVWAYGGAQLIGCEFHGAIKGHGDSDYDEKDETLHLAGGIVAVAEDAIFNGCVFHSGSTYTGGNTTTRFGGILGGVVDRAATTTITPSAVLTECSGVTDNTTVNNASVTWGALIGSAVYGSSKGVTTAKCEGNWWPSAAAAVGEKPSGENDVKVVGKRNAIQPRVETDWFN